jgi:two-component system, cell cycle sensor histidine kinase and response regulator CckA
VDQHELACDEDACRAYCGEAFLRGTLSRGTLAGETMTVVDAEFHSATLRDLPVGVWIARAPSGEFVYANLTFEEIMGTGPVDDPDLSAAPREYGIYDRAGRLYPVSELPFSRALRARELVVDDEIVIHRHDGVRVNVRAFAKPVLDTAGEITHVIVTFIDISAEVRAIGARMVAQERLATAIEHAPIILFCLDTSGTVTLSEGAGLAALGRKSGELVGVSIHELYAGQPTLIANAERALAGEAFTTVDEVGDAYLESWLSPLRDETGRVTGAIGVCTDITNRRRLEAKAVLADRVMAMGRLSASVAHEINNPLTYMMISLSRMDEESLRVARSLELDELLGDARGEALARIAKLRELLAVAREGAERVRVVTQDLRSFSRPDDERTQAVDVCRVVRNLLSLVTTETEARARLVVELAPVPLVAANEARLLQVFLNLLRNAAQAVPDGDASRQEIRFSTRAVGRIVQIDVSDSGSGVPAAIRDRIFEPFFTTKGVGEGTGLGLFVSRNIARSLGGDVVALDRPGGGALFRVTLPIHPMADAVAPAHEIEAPERTRIQRRGRVLIVDDDLRVGRMLLESLSAEHDVELAGSGREALALLAGGAAFDLIFCDVMMRDVAGMDVHRELGTMRPGDERKIVFMSGGAFSDRARAFLETVGNDRLSKPFDILAEVRKRLA